jgi:thioredoxin 1
MREPHGKMIDPTPSAVPRSEHNSKNFFIIFGYEKKIRIALEFQLDPFTFITRSQYKTRLSPEFHNAFVIVEMKLADVQIDQAARTEDVAIRPLLRLYARFLRHVSDDHKLLSQCMRSYLRQIVCLGFDSGSGGFREMSGRLVELNSETFKQVLTSNLPVAVDFYADWCIPCVATDSMIEKLAEEYQGRLTFARLNVDENHQITDNYEIMSIPALLIFSKGKTVKRFVGARKIKGCKRAINRLLDSL